MAKVSVILPIYNAETHLDEAIKSVLHQTYQNVELILIDDASSDQSRDIALRYIGANVKLIENFENVGVAESLNRAISHCNGKYVARMDADDICLPTRLEKQVRFLEDRSQVGVCGTWVKHIGRYEGVLEKKPVGSQCIKAFMTLDNPIMHPTVMMRRSVLNEFDFRYDASFERCEDFDLWERISQIVDIDNIPEPLLEFRVHETSVTAVHSDEMWQKTYAVLQRGLKRLCIDADSSEIAFHRKVFHGEPLASISELNDAEKWYNYIYLKNSQEGLHDDRALHEALGFAWYTLCRNSSHLGMEVWKRYRKSKFAGCEAIDITQKVTFGLVACFRQIGGTTEILKGKKL